jgi:hypothetical protein
MQANLNKLAELKIKLVTATNFKTIFNFFFDHFGENEEFLKVGGPKHNELLQQVLVTSAQSVLKKSAIIVNNLLMVYVEEKQFYHGCAMFNHMLVNFFYFEDIDAGLLALAPLSSEAESVIIRFSIRAVSGVRKTPSN